MRDNKWTYKPLSELCGINLGNTPSRSKSEYWGKGYPWVSISDLKEKFISKTKEEITDTALAESNCKIVKKGTLLMSFKLSIGKLAFAEKDLYTNEAIVALPIKDESQLLKEYLYYVLKSIPLVGGNQAAMGTTLNKQSLSVLQIPLPPTLDEQKRIAKVLSQCEDLIQKRKESIDLLDELLRSTFLEMFGTELADNNKDNWIPLGQTIELLADYHANGSYESLNAKITIKTEKDFALMVRTTDLEKNDFESDCRYLNEEEYNYLSKSKIFGNEIIITKIGSAGNVYLMPVLNRPVSLGMNAFLLRLKEDFEPVFIYYFLTSPLGKSSIMRNVKGAVTKTITKDAVRGIKIPKVDPKKQNEYKVIVEKVVPIKKQLKESLQELENLYGSISQRAFNGKLDLSKVDISDMEDSKKKDEKFVMEKEKQDITFMTLADFLQIPKEIQMQQEGIELDFINDPLFYQFFLKNHFKDRSFLLEDVEGIFNQIYIPKGHDYNYEAWKEYIFNELKSKSPKIEQYLDEESKVKRIKLKLTDEAFKA